jgi:hypothetical protein
MKRRRAGTVLALAALVAAAGCKKEAPGAPGGQSSSGATAQGAASGDAGARVALTREQVDRFVKYQTRLVALYDQVLEQRAKERAAPVAHLPDGGVADPVKVSLQLFEGKAKAEEQARAEAGLSMPEVRAIEPVVAEVINERTNARDENVEAAIQQYQAMRDKLPEDQRKPVEEQLADLKADHERRMKNVDQREKFGDAAVDAVLGREADLARLRTEWVKRIGALSR